MTPFAFTHDLRASSVADVFAVYVDPAHLEAIDRKGGVARREMIELTLDERGYRRVCKVTAERQLPVFVRPFVSGPLQSDETATWDRQNNWIDIRVQPSILKGKAVIAARYQVDPLGPGIVRRTYSGTVSVEMALVGGKIERGIIEDLGKTLDGAVAVTQEFLDRRAGRGPSAS